MRPPAKKHGEYCEHVQWLHTGNIFLANGICIVEVTNTLSAVPTTVLLADIHKLVTKDELLNIIL